MRTLHKGTSKQICWKAESSRRRRKKWTLRADRSVVPVSIWQWNIWGLLSPMSTTLAHKGNKMSEWREYKVEKFPLSRCRFSSLSDVRYLTASQSGALAVREWFQWWVARNHSIYLRMYIVENIFPSVHSGSKVHIFVSASFGFVHKAMNS